MSAVARRAKAEGVIRRFKQVRRLHSRRSFGIGRRIAQGTSALEPQTAHYAGACHRAAPCADSFGPTASRTKMADRDPPYGAELRDTPRKRWNSNGAELVQNELAPDRSDPGEEEIDRDWPNNIRTETSHAGSYRNEGSRLQDPGARRIFLKKHRGCGSECDHPRIKDGSRDEMVRSRANEGPYRKWVCSPLPSRVASRVHPRGVILRARRAD